MAIAEDKSSTKGSVFLSSASYEAVFSQTSTIKNHCLKATFFKKNQNLMIDLLCVERGASCQHLFLVSGIPTPDMHTHYIHIHQTLWPFKNARL